MSLLINLLNDCFRQNSRWKFHVIQESNWKWVNIQIEYGNSEKTINSSPNWDKNELVRLYWEAGLIPSESES